MKVFTGQLLAAMLLLCLPATGIAQKGASARKRATSSAHTTSRHTLNAQQIFEQFHASVVKVETDKKQGSGFFVRDGQSVATAYHVVAGATHVRIIGSQNETWVPVTCYLDPKADIAIFGLAKNTSHKPIRLADFSKLRPGTDVTVISNALGLEGSVSTGVLSERRIDDSTELIQFSAAISPGSSGAPVLSNLGEAVGVVTSTLKGGQAINLAVAEPAIHRLLQRFPTPMTHLFGLAAEEEAARKNEELADKQRRADARIADLCSQADASMERLASLTAKSAPVIADFTSAQKNLEVIRGLITSDLDKLDRNYRQATLVQGFVTEAKSQYATDLRLAKESAKYDTNGTGAAGWEALLANDRYAIADRERDYDRLVEIDTRLRVTIHTNQDKASQLTTELQILAVRADQFWPDLKAEESVLERVCLASEQDLDPAKDIVGDWISTDGVTCRFTEWNVFSIVFTSKDATATIFGQFESLGGRLNLNIVDVKSKADSKWGQAEADKQAAAFAQNKKDGKTTLRNFQLWKSKTELSIIGSDGKRIDLKRM